MKLRPNELYKSIYYYYYYYYSARSYSFTEYLIDFKARFDGLHTAGYNSTESEPIWMQFGM